MNIKSPSPVISKIIGYAFTLVTLVYFIKQAYSSFDEITTYEWSPEQLIILILSSGLILFIGLLSGIAWHVLLMDQGANTNIRINIGALCTSQIAKYIPGNVGQYFGRIYFSRENGIPAVTTTASMAIETLWLIFIAATLTVITLLFFSSANATPQFLEHVGFVQLLLITFFCFLGPALLIRLLRLATKITNTNFFARVRIPKISTSL